MTVAALALDEIRDAIMRELLDAKPVVTLNADGSASIGLDGWSSPVSLPGMALGQAVAMMIVGFASDRADKLLDAIDDAQSEAEL